MDAPISSLRRDGHEKAADRRAVFDVAAGVALAKLHGCTSRRPPLAPQAILKADLEAVASEHRAKSVGSP